MTDKITDIINQFKIRFSSPLFFSFLCSWIVYNWEIVISLIWYDTEQIEKSHTSIFEFISAKINLWDSFLCPFLIALVYTFLIKNLISIFIAWTNKWGENFVLKVSEGGKIPIEKYFSLKNNLTIRTEILEKTIEEESENIKLLESTKTELLSAKNELNTRNKLLSEANDIISKIDDPTLLNGYWTYKFIQDRVEKEFDIYINGSKIHLISPLQEKKHIYDVRYFHHNKKNNEIFFIKIRTIDGQGYPNFMINELHINNYGNLIGLENHSEIEYIKKQHQ